MVLFKELEFEFGDRRDRPLEGFVGESATAPVRTTDKRYAWRGQLFEGQKVPDGCSVNLEAKGIILRVDYELRRRSMQPIIRRYLNATGFLGSNARIPRLLERVRARNCC